MSTDLDVPPPQDRRWPEGAVVYHIYPRSLQDSNGDGIGDLPGIIQRLDYIHDLGATAIWLSPFYPSPMADFGYDVADYQGVHPMFGTLDDFQNLLAECESRGLKVLIDLVPNHTSDEHVWFQHSRESRENPYSDWYIWRDPANGSSPDDPQPPNNWRDALTGGSAWEWEPKRQQFYLHSFDVRQPDLNWFNADVREAMKAAMRFWLDLGVDGFRVDAVYWMGKEPLLSDDPLNPDYVEGEDLLYEALLHENSQGWPFVYSYMSEMAEVLKEERYLDKQRFMVTEAYPPRHNSLAAYMSFYVGMDPEVAAPFNFEGISLPWEAHAWQRFLRSFHTALAQFSEHCVASYAFGNHDQPRLASRLGEAAARSVAVMQLTLPGMAFVYYGEELGMHDVEIPPEFVQDPAAKGDPKRGVGRDPQRTPMQWSADRHAGFSSAQQTWLPVGPDYLERNAMVQSQDPASFLSLYKRLANLRKSSPALRYGHLEVLDTDQPDLLAYVRTDGRDERFVVLINFSDSEVTVEPGLGLGRLVISSDPQTGLAEEMTGGAVTLRGHEAALWTATPGA